MALQVERAGEPAEQRDAQRGVLLAQRGGGLLEQLVGALVDHAGPPARLLVADRRARQQLGVAALAGDRRRPPERVEGIDRVAGPVARVAQLEEDLRPVEAEGDRGLQLRGRLVVGERRGRRPRRQQVELGGALGRAERHRGGEVMGEVGERAAGARLAGVERLGDTQVQLRPARPRQPVVERAPHELVGEAAGEPARRDLVDHPAAERLVQCGQQLGVLEPGGAPDHVEPELGARRRRQLEQLGGVRREPGQPLADDLAHALGAAELLRRAVDADRAARELDRAALDQPAPQLADQERVAVGELADRLRERERRGAQLAAPGAADELGHVAVGEPGEPQPHDVVAAQVGERLRQRVGDVRLGVAVGGEHEDPRLGGAREMAQEQERRCVGPVRVLEHEQGRTLPRDAGEQVGHGAVQAVALGVRVGVDGRRQLAEPRAEVGQEPDQLAARGARRLAQLGRGERPGELVERLDERPVGRAHHGVAGAVEHEQAVARRLGGELAHEPALARSRLAAEQRDAAALAVGTRNQRAEPLQLRGATDERERRGDAQGAGQGTHQ